MGKRIAITGIGVVSSLGIGLEKFRESIESGLSGIGNITNYRTGEFPVKIAAEVKDFEARDFIPRKAIKVMARDIQLACAAAKLALDDTNLDRNSVPPERIGVSLGAGLINADINELGVVASHSTNEAGKVDIKKFGGAGIKELMPLWLLKQLPNMPSSHISIIHNLHGPTNSITAGCASSVLSIGESMGLIQSGRADVILSGGADSKINPLSILRFHLLKLLALGWDKPEEASRPFDKKRNGFVAGEGAGVVALEEFSMASARGAKVYAELIGFGASFSNKTNREESIKGKILAMNQAIKNAGIKKEDISLIAAHGLSTQEDDFEEREAIQKLFGEGVKTIPVIAAKSTMGYAGAASGVLDLIAVTGAMENGVIPVNRNYTERDDGDYLNYVTGAPLKKEINCAMINVFGMGGQNGVIIIKRKT